MICPITGLMVPCIDAKVCISNTESSSLTTKNCATKDHIMLKSLCPYLREKYGVSSCDNSVTVPGNRGMDLFCIRKVTKRALSLNGVSSGVWFEG
jgi:hypothetical protein